MTDVSRAEPDGTVEAPADALWFRAEATPETSDHMRIWQSGGMFFLRWPDGTTVTFTLERPGVVAPA